MCWLFGQPPDVVRVTRRGLEAGHRFARYQRLVRIPHGRKYQRTRPPIDDEVMEGPQKKRLCVGRPEHRDPHQGGAAEGDRSETFSLSEPVQRGRSGAAIEMAPVFEVPLEIRVVQHDLAGLCQSIHGKGGPEDRMPSDRLLPCTFEQSLVESTLQGQLPLVNADGGRPRRRQKQVLNR